MIKSTCKCISISVALLAAFRTTRATENPKKLFNFYGDIAFLQDRKRVPRYNKLTVQIKENPSTKERWVWLNGEIDAFDSAGEDTFLSEKVPITENTSIIKWQTKVALDEKKIEKSILRESRFLINFLEEKSAKAFSDQIKAIKKQIAEEKKESSPDNVIQEDLKAPDNDSEVGEPDSSSDEQADSTDGVVDKMKKIGPPTLVVFAVGGVIYLGYRLLKKPKQKILIQRG